MEEMTFRHTGFSTPSLEDTVRFWSEVMGFHPMPTVERKGDWIWQFTALIARSTSSRIFHATEQFLNSTSFASPPAHPGSPGLPTIALVMCVSR